MKYIAVNLSADGTLTIHHNILNVSHVPESDRKYSSYGLDEMIERVSENHKVPVVLVGDTYKDDHEISLAKQLSIASVDIEEFGALWGYSVTFKSMVSEAIDNKGLMRTSVQNPLCGENADMLVDHFRACYDHLLRLIGHSENDTDTDYLGYYYIQDVIDTLDIIDVLIVYRYLHANMKTMLLNKRACNK